MQNTVLGGVVAAVVLGLSLASMPAPAVADGLTKFDPKCMCRANGQRYTLGEYACIQSKLARCEMFLNNTTWKFTSDSCGSVKLDRPQQSAPAESFAGLQSTD